MELENGSSASGNASDVTNVNEVNPSQSAGQRGLRRQALGFTVMAGVTSVLAACGKFFASPSKSQGVAPGIAPPGGVLPTEGPTPTPTSADGIGVTPTPNPANPDQPSLPVPAPASNPSDPAPSYPLPCVSNASSIAGYSAANVFATHPNTSNPIFAAYGFSSFSLLAFKLRVAASGGAPGCAVGDLVSIMAKVGSNSFVMASRRVVQADLVDNNASIAMIFESVFLANAEKVEIVISKSATSHYKVELNYPTDFYKKKMNDGTSDIDVYDLGLTRNSAEQSKAEDLFDEFAFGGGASDSVPTMASTTALGSNATTLGNVAHQDAPAAYLAANNNTMWNLSSLLPNSGSGGIEQRIVTNIFGEVLNIANTASTSLPREHQAIVVYLKKTKSVNNVNVTRFIRYFFHLG